MADYRLSFFNPQAGVEVAKTVTVLVTAFDNVPNQFPKRQTDSMSMQFAGSSRPRYPASARTASNDAVNCPARSRTRTGSPRRDHPGPSGGCGNRLTTVFFETAADAPSHPQPENGVAYRRGGTQRAVTWYYSTHVATYVTLELH